MRTITKIKIALLTLAVLNLPALLLVLPTVNPTNLDSDSLTALIHDYPIRTTMAAGGLLILLGLAIWSIAWRPPHRLYRRYAGLDSNGLDRDSALCRAFYSDVLDYRIKFGSRKYRRYIVNHFEFFYEFHNYALEWIDDIVRQTSGYIIPREFIRSAISSGQIGQVFTQVNYASGLTRSRLKTNEPVLFHTCAEVLEIWSYQSDHALCKIRRNTIKLQNCQRHNGYTSASFIGVDQNGSIHHKIGLRFFGDASKHSTFDDQVAKERILAFKSWLKEVAIPQQRQKGDYGIDVSELTNTQPRYHEPPLFQTLQRLQGRLISRYYLPVNATGAQNPINFDAIVLCNGLGIIGILENHEGGHITYSGEAIWHQSIGGQQFEVNNPCLQLSTARASLSYFLSQHNLARWPIYNLIVFTATDIRLNLAVGEQGLQCEVIKLENLEDWFSKHLRDDSMQFKRDDIHQFNTLFPNHRITPLQLATV